MLAPRSNDAPSDRGTACEAGRATTSCALPFARCRAASQSQTRFPTRLGSTSAPTATIVPAPSMFGTISGNARGRPGPSPLRAFQSVGFTPDTATRTTTSSSVGSGSGRSTSFKTSGPPVSVYTIAFMRADGSVARSTEGRA